MAPHRMSRPDAAHRDRGAAAVEFALILPVLLFLVLGIIDFGRALNTQISLTAAAREGVRWAALGQPNVAGRVALAAPGISPAPAVSSTSCAPGASIGSTATVQVTSTYTLLTPLDAVAGLVGGTFPSSFTLTGRGVMRCGG